MTVALRASLCALALAAPTPTLAQSTDGFHAIQVLPVVVDTASFRTRLTFTNPTSSTRTVRAYYVPAEGTTQATELDCGTFTMGAGQGKTFESLREVCSALPVGSQFGTLHTMIAAPVPGLALISYSAYARIENPQGIGFSVEGFPAHTLTGARSMVAGLRRLAATPSSPAYQTNCFVGVLHREQAAAAATATVEYDLVDDAGNWLGSGEIPVPPGKLVRVLDIFGHAGLPAGNYDNVRSLFYLTGAAVTAFCTVQDNTSFGADFRIAKQFQGLSIAQSGSSPFAQDDHVLRRTVTWKNVPLSDGAGGFPSQDFVIPASGAGNTHLLQVRNPDWLSCWVEAPGNGMPLSNLEIRLIRARGPFEGAVVVAGGNDVSYFAPVYLGDKSGLEQSNSRYLLEVEGKEPGAESDIAYGLRCFSGSGHSVPDLVRTGGPNQF
jgi:hypothetical protein